MSQLARLGSLVSVRPAHRVSSNGHIRCCVALVRGVLAASCLHASIAHADDASGPAAATTTTTPGAAATPTAAAPSKIDFFPNAPVENGISVGFRLGYAYPSGGLADIEPRHEYYFALGQYAKGQVPLWFDAGYLVNPYFYVGAYFSYGIVQVPQCQSCSSSDVRFGVDVQVRFLGRNAFQPWLGLGFLGYERLGISPAEFAWGTSNAFDGVEWVSPEAGMDYKLFPALSAGIFTGISLSKYLGASVSGREPDHIYASFVHSWAYVGGRINYDLHL
jgi:hypothetical protein